MPQRIASESATLSIVTPTRGNFSDSWLESLLAVQGNVEFILVFPPGIASKAIEDPRVRTIVSPFKGENIQRSVGLLNASAPYIMALDDDDFVHPDIITFVKSYFSIYPDSWCFQPAIQNISYENHDEIFSSWPSLLDLNQLTVIPPSPKPTIRRQVYADSEILEEVPIAPLTNKFNWFSLWYKFVRTDQDGAHRENFNNRIWKTAIVQNALCNLLERTRLLKVLVWMPFWGLDRLLSLFLQGKYYEENLIIGHRTWEPCAVRYITMPYTKKQGVRAIFPSDMLLALSFPQYGYLWNLFWFEWWRSLGVWRTSFLKKMKSTCSLEK